jgi:hypothetical protein
MRLSRRSPAQSGILSSLLFSAFVAASGSIDCAQIVDDGVSWDLSKLGGPRSVMHSVLTPPSMQNTTYTIDICKPLKRPESVKDMNKCPGGTRGELILI